MINGSLSVYQFDNRDMRTFTDESGTVWFVGKDVAKILGYQNLSKAVADHVDDDDKLNNVSLSSLGQRGGWLINESGLYSLVLSSKLPSARKFKHWVTSEVLPSIRQHGAYMTPDTIEQTLNNPDFIIQLATQLKNAQQRVEVVESENRVQKQQIEAQEQQLIEQEPKVVFANAVSASKHNILVGELAKTLRSNGVDIGTHRLFEYLRQHGYLIKRKGHEWNAPTQKSLELELMVRIERTVVEGNSTKCAFTTLITPKGQIYFVNHFLKRRDPDLGFDEPKKPVFTPDTSR
ncbi:BRO family protein [Alloscardovia omnicolens]|uniref:BRO family protein n=1 Tax=Alloscardovia omnicolens TaxID=419015 RepID=UPI0006657D81|nr:BRO family protein [Alloscardovia omnicolens]